VAAWCTYTWASTGTFTEVPLPLPPPVGQVRMRMIGAEYGTDLRGPTVCEVIEEPGIADVVARLGPDPLRRDADPAPAWLRISKSRRPIGGLLMDQAVIAGIGNVYRNELLYRHRIDPYRPGTHLGESEFGAMWSDLVELMKVGLRRGKIIVVRPEHDHGPPSYAVDRAHLCLPPRRRAVPGVRHHDPHRRVGRSQSVLVPDVPEVRAAGRSEAAEVAAAEVAAAEVAAAEVAAAGIPTAGVPAAAVGTVAVKATGVGAAAVQPPPS